jgi:hypothetical protein
MKRLLGTTLSILIPLLAICAVAQATAIYEFGSTVVTSCAGTDGNCTGGTMSGTTTPANGSTPGQATLFINSPETYTALSEGTGSGEFDLTWSGTGDGTLSSYLPIFWDFMLTPVGGTASIAWNLEMKLGTGLSATYLTPTGSSWNVQTPGQQDIGYAQIPTGALNGTTLGPWEVLLTVAFVPVEGGDGVTVSQIPSTGLTFDLGGTVPEPATWGQAGGGLLFALLLFSRKLRRR